MLSTRDPPQTKGHIQTESEELVKDTSWKWRPKKSGVAILISDKIDFEIKALKRDKEGYDIMIKGSIQEEDITILNIWTSLVAQMVKRLPTMWETRVQSHFLLQGRSPGEGNGNPLQYSCLENPMDEGAWWAKVHGVTKSWTLLNDFTFTVMHPT